VSKIEEYRGKLRGLRSRDEYLLASSGLPGPRGNIELAQAAADVLDGKTFLRYLAFTADRAPTNTPEEFLAFCGTVGLGRLAAEGDDGALRRLRAQASDTRWRVREGTAMALQRLGDVDMSRLVREMTIWAGGSPLEQRAAAAALCEPRLLKQPESAAAALEILDRITSSVSTSTDRGGEGFIALRKGLGYCWSVAVVALPGVGKPLMEKWLHCTDRDVRWIMKENLGKSRLLRMDPAWVERCRATLLRPLQGRGRRA